MAPVQLREKFVFGSTGLFPDFDKFWDFVGRVPPKAEQPGTKADKRKRAETAGNLTVDEQGYLSTTIDIVSERRPTFGVFCSKFAQYITSYIYLVFL